MSEMIIGILAAAAAFLAGKVLLLHCSFKEITVQLREKLREDTNTKITAAVRNPQIRRLAAELNVELEHMRALQIKYLEGDQNLKMAVTNISHDLRTPLTVISAYLEMMEKETDPAKQREYLDVIRERTEELRQMTEELFAYTFFTGEREMILPEKTEVSRVLEKALSDYYAVFRGCRIVPEISLPEHTVWRMGNEKALQRVFGNILSNAVKYSKGDLKIRMTEAGEVIFSNRAPDLDVTKAGRLLERYFTLNQGRDASGLGLSIARTLTEQMQGKLEAKYRNGELQIRLWLPDVPEE